MSNTIPGLADTFRTEVREFIDRNLPAETREALRSGLPPSKPQIVEWQRILNDRGWATPLWPKEYGGPGWTTEQRLIFMDEIFSAPAPEPFVFNANMVGPMIINFGTPEQKKRFLSSLANLDLWFCIGMSEPNAGSDLASLKTSARRDGDEFVVNGQKIWTTTAHHADWICCMVRTDPQAKKHLGISVLLIDLKSPGVTINPIRTIDRLHHFNEVFFADVRVPADNLVGEENKGWDYAKFLLTLERYGQARVGVARQKLEHAKRAAALTMRNGRPLVENPTFREKVALIEGQLLALEITQHRVISASEAAGGQAANPMTSILKILGTELLQATTELAYEAGGIDALHLSIDSGASHDNSKSPSEWASSLAPAYYFSRAATIYGGTSEIQKNILARAVLGLK